MNNFVIVFFLFVLFFSTVIGHNIFPLSKGVLHIHFDFTDTFTNFFNWDDEKDPKFIRGKWAYIISSLMIVISFLAIFYLFYENNTLIISKHISNLIAVILGLLLGIYFFRTNKRKYG